MSGELIRIGSTALSVELSTRGAELRRIVDAEGRDLLWSGDPAWWIGRAPLLFPIVGALAGGVLRVEGREYRLPKHGFARVSEFTLVERSDRSALLRLEASDETRRQYPFDFRLDAGFEILGTALTVTAMLYNPGRAPLPASFGFHPALRWPLPGGGQREDHVLRFEQTEPAPVRRIDRDGLLTAVEHPSPVEGALLQPRDALFDDDAVILPAVNSSYLWYGVPGSPGARIAWNLPSLGIWTKPGAPFLCIEPWQGMADPQGFAGEFRDKPGVIEIPPGGHREFILRLSFGVEVPG